MGITNQSNSVPDHPGDGLRRDDQARGVAGGRGGERAGTSPTGVVGGGADTRSWALIHSDAFIPNLNNTQQPEKVRPLKIVFNADVSDTTPWKFWPTQPDILVGVSCMHVWDWSLVAHQQPTHPPTDERDGR